MNGLGGYCQRLFEIGDDGRLEKMVILWELGMGFGFGRGVGCGGFMSLGHQRHSAFTPSIDFKQRVECPGDDR